MRRGFASCKRSKAARRQAAPGLSVFVGATLASMVCLCCCAHSRPQGCPRRVGLPPQRDRGSHECPASTNSRRLAARLSGRALFALPPSALGAPSNDDGSRHLDPLEPVLRPVPAGAAGRSIGWGLMLGRASGDDAIDATRRQTRQARSYSSRVERQLDVHEPVNVVRHRRHAAPRREGRPGNDVDRAAAAPALLVVRVRLL